MARLGHYHHTILLHNNFVPVSVDSKQEHLAEYQRQTSLGIVQVKVFDRYSMACFKDKEVLIRSITRTREYSDLKEQNTDQDIDQNYLNQLASFEQMQDIFRHLDILDELDLTTPFSNKTKE